MIYSKSKPILKNTKSCRESNMKLTRCSSWCDLNKEAKNQKFSKTGSNKLITFREKEFSSSTEMPKRNKENKANANDDQSTYFTNDMRSNYNSLKILLDSKMKEIMNLNKILDKKDRIINEYAEKINRLEYIAQYKDVSRKCNDCSCNEFTVNSPINKKIQKKEKEIKSLKNENLKCKTKMLSYEKDLERFYLRRYEREIANIKRNFESKFEEIIEENELRNRELIREIHELKEVLKGYRNNYISLNDHEIILNKLKNDLYKEIRNQKNKLDLIQSRRTEESQLITEFDLNRNKNQKQKKAYNFINVDPFNSHMESTAKFSYTNTEFKDGIFSTKNKDKNNILVMNNFDLSNLNISKINESRFNCITDEVIYHKEDKIHSVKSLYPNLKLNK